MLEDIAVAMAVVASVGTGLLAGLYFIFSTCVMTALARLPRGQSVAAMNAINEVILNPAFFLVFFGTTAVAIGLIVVGAAETGRPSAVWQSAGAILLILSNLGVTVAFNVPLNNKLAKVEPDDANVGEAWTKYHRPWVAWNHVRTLGCIGALCCFTMALAS